MTKLEIEIDGEVNKFDIPNNWEEITVGEYQEIMKIKTPSNLEKIIKILSIISDIDEDIFNKIPVSKLDDIVKLLEFTNEDINKEAKDYININGVDYYTKKDMNDLTFGEVVSIEVLQKEKKFSDIISKVLCIFLRKKLDNGKLETFDKSFMEREEMFKKISIVDVHQLFIFFSNIEK